MEVSAPTTNEPAAAPVAGERNLSEETATRLVALLESIDTKMDGLSRIEAQLDSLHDMVMDMKMDVSGFEHQGANYPGRLENIESALNLVQTTLESFDGSPKPTDPNTSSEAP